MLKIGLWGNFLLHRTFSFSLRCYLYHLPDMWRKICHVEKFQISLRDKCGEIWYFSTWGVFSNIAIWKMWINLKFLHIWHMCDEENGSTCVKFMLFCCKIGFVAIYTLLSQIFLSRFTLFCVEKKLTNNCVVGEKMTNIRYGCHIFYIYTTLQCYKVKYAATLQQIPKLSRFLKSAEWIRYIPIYLDLPSDCDIWPAD